jgi:hypothetical protein
MRGRLPLVSCDNQLLAVADLWVSRPARAASKEAGLEPLRLGGPPVS